MQPQSLNLLIVDDHHDCADSLALFLRMDGRFSVETAYTAADALRLAPRFVPHAALVDIGLPEKDGYQFGRELKALCPRCRIIALTGFSQPSAVRRSAECGFVAHLVKPVDPRELIRVVLTNIPGACSQKVLE